MRRLIVLALLLLPLVPARAEAVTVRDIVELSRAGLSEDVLLALIEVDASVFAIDAATLKTLKDAGVSQKVIVAMVRSGRTPPARVPEPVVVKAPPSDPVPPVVVLVHDNDHHAEPEATPVQQVAVPVPIYVPVYPTHGRPVPRTSSSGTRFIPTTGLSAPPPIPSTEAPGSRRTARPERPPDPRPDR